jgi:putative autoinducer-2 (AI-2) aldolase
VVAYNAINDGASGVDMGRNVFQAADPIAMIKAVRAVVHDGEKADKAFQLYNDMKK